MAYDQDPDSAAAPAGLDAGTPEQEPRRRRGLMGLVSLLLSILLIIIVLMLLRGCGVSTSGGDDSGRTRTIEPVLGSDEVAGLVSVWLGQGADIDEVLARAGVSAAGKTQVEQGYYVVEVATGTEQEAVAALKRTGGVVDAGLVFADGDGSPATSTP